MVNIYFLYPQYLYFLFAIPLLFVIHFFALNYKRKVALRFANFDAIAKIKGIDFFSKNIVMLIISSLLILSIVFSLSGMQLETTAKATDFSFIIAIDSSQSMNSDDLNPTRIAVAKETAKNFIDSSGIGTKIGVVSFSGSTFVINELSQDKLLSKNSIDSIEIETTGGTDLEDAVINSINLLRGENSKAVILISDGQLNSGEIEDTIYYANKNDVLVHTIAMGTSEGGYFDGALSKLDSDTLKALSFNTGGVSFDVQDKNNLTNAFNEILQFNEKQVKVDYSRYLLFFSIICFLLIFFLSNTKFLNLP
ncbi:VWA domain-containing protein [archaeon]|jgi:Ca-activated chloride channel homolog|nr:VWA domain-containing protein [archaeon]